MRCTSPRTVGFKTDGKTIAWSQKQYSKEYATFKLPCSKCLECRLEYGRSWAVRSTHEAFMHPENSFITLTYRPEDLKSPKLQYKDFQDFMKRLRRTVPQEIGLFVTGEYGELTHRPHWHALLFNYRPKDLVYKYTTDRGDNVFTSKQLDELWSHGNCELGDVTFHSAGYVARYAAKKLVHGFDGTHDFEPISKKSNKHAIGKKWLEKYWATDCFNKGYITLEDGKQTSIPRYYEKWLKDNEPQAWLRYVTGIKQKNITRAEEKTEKEEHEYFSELRARPFHKPNPLTLVQRKKIILEAKFEQLQNHLKL